MDFPPTQFRPILLSFFSDEEKCNPGVTDCGFSSYEGDDQAYAAHSRIYRASTVPTTYSKGE